MKEIIKKYSENVAGFMGILGNIILLALGDVNGISAAVLAMLAGVCLARFGHKTWGYSLASSLFMIANAILVFTPSLEQNFAVQFSLWVIVFAWAIGTSRYFFEISGYKKIADICQPISGLLNVIFKVPGMMFAFQDGQYIVGSAILCWIFSDVLAGRLQEKIGFLKRKRTD
ncbi:MAG: hypothetical protein CMP22_02470 [Rickettsiales bacterium]|nr:hypothetical protein [Rickettsiales bacterium]|tara:strand:+ start:785 stop:1300 length:516 start_codon:yes stop_codon:yes gene_type:complete